MISKTEQNNCWQDWMWKTLLSVRAGLAATSGLLDLVPRATGAVHAAQVSRGTCDCVLPVLLVITRD